MTLNEPRPNFFVAEEPQTQGLGGAHPKSVFIDDIGRPWLFKPQSLEQTMVDIAAARIADMSGAPTPVVYAADFMWNGKRRQGSIQPNMRSDITKWELTRTLLDLTDQQRGELQKHQVADWLLSNADPHRKNFLVLDDDRVVGIDKAQSLRFFPHDRLQWHANAWPANTRPPVYRSLLEGVLNGRFQLLPDTATTYARQVQNRLAGTALRDLWRPCVRNWPWHRLVCATLNPALPKSRAVRDVLDMIDRRRDQLEADFQELYFQKSNGVW